MPPPHKPSSFGAAGLSEDKIAEIDPDYLYFLDHVRLDGPSYTVEIPSKDGASPPEVIKYEESLAGPNVKAPGAGHEGGGKGSPSPMEEDKSAAGEVPSGGAPLPASVKNPVVSRRGGAGSGAVPMDGDNMAAPATEPAWYDSDPNIDEDYRLFLRHACAVNDAETVFEMGDFSVTLGDDSEGEEDEEEEEEEDEEEEEEEEDDDGDDDFGTKEGEDEEVKKESEAEEEDHVPASGEDDVGTEEAKGEKSKGENGEREVDVGSECRIANALVFDELGQKVKGEEEAIPVDGGVWKGKGVCEKENEGEVNASPDWPMVNVFEFEGPLQEMKEEVVEEEQPLNMQATSSKGHHAVPQNTSELQGVIWPTHIMERPESEFKQKLMEVLNKPFNLAEYDDLLATATNRTPVIKERRTRRRVVNYPWKYEMSKSYFDCYPDLADLVERNSYPNRLALLRGFFFWLKNIGHEDQFRPWRDDYKKYRVFHDYYP